MTEKFSWTAGFGRWRGVNLQIHLCFFLFGSVVYYVAWVQQQLDGTLLNYDTAAATILVVLLSAIGHELAHAFAATTLGGRLQELVLTPWGGPSEMLLPPEPHEQLIVHAAGPFFNASVFALGALLLLTSRAATEHLSIWALVNPMEPFALQSGELAISLTKIVTWVNFQMLLVNLIPAFPFDASHLIRSAALTYNPRTPAISLENAILGAGIASGVLMFLFAWLAWLSGDNNSWVVRPAWLVLVVSGVLLIFSARYGYYLKVAEARHELQMLDRYVNYRMMEEDFDTSDSWMSEFEEDAIADWLQDQKPRNETAERTVASDEESRVDAILKKLHERGQEALTDDEREFLNRISQQYRRRRELRS
jgi:hypothetical protein